MKKPFVQDKSPNQINNPDTITQVWNTHSKGKRNKVVTILPRKDPIVETKKISPADLPFDEIGISSVRIGIV